MAWGYHTLFDCKSCPREKIGSEDNIRSFIKNIVWKIDMKAYGDPMIARLAGHDPELTGYSFCQMIETSNITGHFMDKSGDCYIDIFSCKEYDKDIARKVINDFFEPQGISMKYIERSA